MLVFACYVARQQANVARLGVQCCTDAQLLCGVHSMHSAVIVTMVRCRQTMLQLSCATAVQCVFSLVVSCLSAACLGVFCAKHIGVVGNAMGLVAPTYSSHYSRTA
jgi:hypothetical protein